MAKRARPVLDGYWDYDLLVEALPGSIVQTEGLLSVSPDNPQLMLGLANAYLAYAGIHLADQAELAEDAGDLARADHLRQRAYLMCLRARNLALRALRGEDAQLDVVLAAAGFADARARAPRDDWQARLREEGFADAASMLNGRPEVFSRHLRAHYSKDAMPALSSAAGAWGLAIALSGGDPERMREVELARALLLHAAAIAPEYAHAAPLAALGALSSNLPPALGGDLQKAKQHFERALSLTQRKSHLVQVQYAKSYAARAQDRALYVALLREVLAAPDLGNDVRLMNKVARRRAEHALAKTDQLF